MLHLSGNIDIIYKNCIVVTVHRGDNYLNQGRQFRNNRCTTDWASWDHIQVSELTGILNQQSLNYPEYTVLAIIPFLLSVKIGLDLYLEALLRAISLIVIPTNTWFVRIANTLKKDLDSPMGAPCGLSGRFEMSILA